MQAAHNFPSVKINLLLSSNHLKKTVLDTFFEDGDLLHLRFYFQEIKYLLGKPGGIKLYRNLHLESCTNNLTLFNRVLRLSKPEMTEVYLQELWGCLSGNLITKEEYNFVLIQVNNLLQTPLHYITISANSANFKIYIQALHKAVEHEIITKNEFIHVLLAQNSGGFSPLLSILHSGSHELLVLYFEVIEKALKQSWIEQADYIRLLLIKNTAGFTCINQAIKTGNLNNLILYIEKIEQAFCLGLISNTTFKNVFISSNKANFSPLQQALKKGNSGILELYIMMLHHLLKTKIISSAEFLNLLIQRCTRAYTPLHDVLLSGNIKNISLYLKELNFALNENIISYGLYCHLLTEQDIGNNTPLHYAVKTGSLEIVRLYVDILRRYLSNEHFERVLNMRNVDGLPPASICSVESWLINQFLAETRINLPMQSIPQTPDTYEEYQLFPSTPNPFAISEFYTPKSGHRQVEFVNQFEFSLFSKPVLTMKQIPYPEKKQGFGYRV